MRAAHPVCCPAAGIKKKFTEIIQGIDFILYVCGIFFIPHPVLYMLLLWNYELSRDKIDILWDLFVASRSSQVFWLSKIMHIKMLKNFFQAILGR